MRAWIRFANWQIRSRMQREVVVTWVNGQRLAVRRGMTGATGNIYAGLHEFADMMFLLHILREGDHFLDIGANVGSYTVLAAGVCGATVSAFEPDPEALRALRRNVDLNGLQNRVVVHELAVGEHDGEVKFTRGLDTVNHIAQAGAIDVRTVQVRKLDTVIGSDTPTLIKMDIEGYEEPAIRGATKVLALDSLKAIELETVSTEICGLLDAHGFKRAHYDPLTRKLTEGSNGIAASNSLFVRDWTFTAHRLATAPKISVLGRLI